MDILQQILRAQGGGVVQQMSRQFGLNDDQTASALSALVPALASGFQKNMSSPQGLDGLLSALGGGNHRQYVDDLGSLGRTGTTTDGNKILGHVLGSKDVSRQVASQVSATTGVGESVVKRMLPIVASLMMGTMSQKVGSSGRSRSGAEGLMSMLTPMLDSDGDGSVADDILGAVGKLFQGR
jgi:hypothetical protein